MRARRLSRLAVAAAIVWLGYVASGAAQAPDNRAAVIVDTGTEVRKVCIQFDAESITGTEALELAGVEPIYSEFGGALGSLVCSLCGVGCPAADCLCARESWWYHRAPAGTDSFATSSLGASNSTVSDGDVEGWSWGTGAAPPYTDIDTVCGLVAVAPTTTTATASTTTITTTTTGAPATTTLLAPPATTTTTNTAAAPTSSSTTTTTRRPSSTTGAAAPLAREGDGGGGSVASLGGAAAVVLAILGLGRWRRRRRRAATVDL